MSTDFERTAGGAVLMDGNRLRDETVARLRSEIESLGSPCAATSPTVVPVPSSSPGP